MLGRRFLLVAKFEPWAKKLNKNLSGTVNCKGGSLDEINCLLASIRYRRAAYDVLIQK